MIEFIIRIGFIIIILLFYWLGELLTEKIDWGVEFKNILPAFSLVFWNYYFNLFARYLFEFKIINKIIVPKNGNKIDEVRAEIKLSYKGNENVNFGIVAISVKKIDTFSIKKEKGQRNLKYDKQNYETPENFNCSIGKDNPVLTIGYVFNKPLTTTKLTFLKYKIYFLKMKIDYTIRYNYKKTKKITFIKIIKK